MLGDVMRIILALLPFMVGVSIAPAVASVSILVDEVHGLPAAEQLAALLPQCEITQLTAADFPLTDILASGTITELSEEIVFDVPPGAETLYGRFVYEGAGMQLPFIVLHGPDGAALIGQCNGSFHVEDPVPGEYTVVYDSWEELTTLYEIGIGPYFFTADTFAGYDLVCSLWDDTYFLFVGTIPPYSPREESVLSAYVESGGGYLYVREPLVAIAMKPIVNLYADATLQCDVAVSFPGALTYAEPPCTTAPEAGGTLCRWEDIAVATGTPAQILYEGKLARQTDWLQVSVAADRFQITNRTPHPLADLSLLRRQGPDDWQLLRLDTVPAGSVVNTTASERLDRRSLAAHLEAQLREGGHQAGLYPAEIDEFITHYRWAERWLAEAEAGVGWCAVYRLSANAYDDFIPLLEQLQPQQQVRTMWVWATNLGDEPAAPRQPAPPAAPAQRAQPSVAESPTILDAATAARYPHLVYHEYGVLWQRGASTGGSHERTPGFLGWEFHDEASLVDPVENIMGDPQRIIFSRPGGHPDAEAILSGVPEVLGWVSGAVIAPWAEQVLTGGEHCYTADDFFLPGSYPPVAVARSLGAGRVAAVADREMLETEPYSPQFFFNLVTWLAQELTAAPELPAPHTHIVSIVPNPFNPRTTITFKAARRGPLHIAIHDLTGKRLAELATGTYDAGTYTVTWDGCDAAAKPLPSGVYLVRLVSDEHAESRKLMLIR